MPNHELVSVIIPFHNRISLLLEAIQSVLDQTHVHFEILLIDDGTMENLTPLKEFIAKDSRIRYIRQENRGVSSARNLGIRMAKGDYVSFLDSDDMFSPSKLEEQLSYMKANQLAFSHTSYCQVDLNGNPLQTIDTSCLTGIAFPKILSSCIIATPTVMVKKDVLDNYHFKETIHIGEDVCLWIDISYNNLIGAIRSPLTKVRVSGNSSAFNRDKQILGVFNILDHIIRNPHYVAYGEDIRILLRNYSEFFSSNLEQAQIAHAKKAAFVNGIPAQDDPYVELEKLKSSVYFKVYDKLRRKRSLRFISNAAIKPALRSTWWIYETTRKLISRTIPF